MRRLAAAALIFAAGLGAAAAREQVPSEHWVRSFDGNLPGCDDSGVIGTLTGRFAAREAGYWASNLTIVEVEHPHQTAYRVNGLDTVPRRYCSATVVTSDRHRRRVDYTLIDGDSFLGFSWGLEYCVGGLDRSYAYAPYCTMARP